MLGCRCEIRARSGKIEERGFNIAIVSFCRAKTWHETNERPPVVFYNVRVYLERAHAALRLSNGISECQESDYDINPLKARIRKIHLVTDIIYYSKNFHGVREKRIDTTKCIGIVNYE